MAQETLVAAAPALRRDTMSATVIVAPRRVEIRQVPLPEPGPGEVRVRLEGCGVCASNLPPWDGRPWFSYPMPPGNLGHEGWGRIDGTGEGVGKLYVGQRVSTLSTLAYAQYAICSAEDAVPLPAELDGEPFPGEPLACAMNVFERSDIRPGQCVAVVGIGFLGALVTRLASSAGAQVVAISRRHCALQTARLCGAREACPLSNPAELVGRIAGLTGGRMCERAIEAVGKQETLDLAGELTAEGGKLVIAGYHQDGLRQVNMQSWNWRGIDVINAHERDPQRYRDGIRRAIEAVTTGRLDPSPLYTHRFAMRDLGAALDTVRDRPDGFHKALIMM